MAYLGGRCAPSLILRTASRVLQPSCSLLPFSKFQGGALVGGQHPCCGLRHGPRQSVHTFTRVNLSMNWYCRSR